MKEKHQEYLNKLKPVYGCSAPNSRVEVSVHVFVYNHANSLRKCLDSILNQKVNFNVEIIVHDDCSTDASLDICREYSDLYPKHIVLVTEKNNLYSKSRGVLDIEDKLLRITHGSFVAFCEGDDYWVDDLKLFTQYNAMINNPTICFCVHKVLVKNVVTGEQSFLPKRNYKQGIMKSKKFIGIVNKDYSFQTSSFFLRVDECCKFYNSLPLFALSMPTNDEAWLLYFGSRTNVLYINKTMSCYNKLSDNSWTSKALLYSRSKKKEQRLSVVRSVEQFNEFTSFAYNKSCQRRIAYNLLMNYINEDNYQMIFNDKNVTKEFWHYNSMMFIKKWIKTYVFKK